jgi:uncharacterized membrane protein (DUF106 family)
LSSKQRNLEEYENGRKRIKKYERNQMKGEGRKRHLMEKGLRTNMSFTWVLKLSVFSSICVVS